MSEVQRVVAYEGARGGGLEGHWYLDVRDEVGGPGTYFIVPEDLVTIRGQAYREGRYSVVKETGTFVLPSKEGSVLAAPETEQQ